MKKNKQFTMIELLVVIAIIGILVSILLPSLEKARENARIAVCMSNHKQMATAYTHYFTKNNRVAVQNDTYASFIGVDGAKGYYRNKARRLNEYADPQIALCPSDYGRPGWSISSYNKSLFIYRGNSYYATHHNSSVGVSTSITNKAKVIVTKFEKPSKKIMFYNQNARNSSTHGWLGPYRKENSWHSLKQMRYPISFIDGHVNYFHFEWKENQSSINGSDQWKIDTLGYY